MQSIEFIEAIRERIIKNDFLFYQNSLENVSIAKDPVWKEIIYFYTNLTKEDKQSFLKFIHIVQVNAVSHLLGILDGSTFLNEKRETFKLTTESSGEIINGDLQDLFLEMEE